MKFKLTLATATALGLLTTGAMAGDNNISWVQQSGDRNSLLVEQDGSDNIAGTRFGTRNSFLSQSGNDNLMEVRQSGDGNNVGVNRHVNSGASQSGGNNQLFITQQSGTGTVNNGNIVQQVIQRRRTGTSGVSTDADGVINRATIEQRRPDGSTGSAAHIVTRVEQTFAGGAGAGNSVKIVQVGDDPTRGNVVGGAFPGAAVAINQGGALGGHGNSVDVLQNGAANNLLLIQQLGNGHEANVSQTGTGNYVKWVRQESGDNNTATISLDGARNGASATGGTIGAFTSGRGAEAAAGALFVSSVYQTGGSFNEVEYRVVGGNDNQFGFRQQGSDNQAVGILITGDRNELGVNQQGTGNRLDLSTIAGNDNIIGLIQTGTDNVAEVNVSGDRNVGYANFTTGPAAALAASQGLSAGLLVQNGTFNQVSLTVGGGTDNVFASLQDNSGAVTGWNKITATQNGSFNQAAVVQLGNQNTANLSQTGSGNSVSIQQ